MHPNQQMLLARIYAANELRRIAEELDERRKLHHDLPAEWVFKHAAELLRSRAAQLDEAATRTDGSEEVRRHH
jgi:hypothetical protein